MSPGKVVNGKIVLEGTSCEEGTAVTVLARDEEGGVALTPDEEAEILLAIAEADRGELVSVEEVLARLARRRGQLSRESPGHEARAGADVTLFTTASGTMRFRC